jgi:hypothetical protein
VKRLYWDEQIKKIDIRDATEQAKFIEGLLRVAA